MKINEIISETIRKVEGGYRLVSRKGKNLGTFPTKAGAQKHEREVQYFKHMNEAGVGHYDMPTKETFMIVISDGTKKRDLVSAENQKKADSIARSLRSKYPDKIVTIEPRTVITQRYNESDLMEFDPGSSDDDGDDGIRLPYYDSTRRTLWVDGISKGKKEKFANFRTENTGRSWAIIGDTLRDGPVKISHTTSKELAEYLVSNYLIMNQR